MREGEGLGGREGDMNHGIGLSSSCAVHLHIRMWKPCQEKEYTVGELSTLQSVQSHISKHTQTLTNLTKPIVKAYHDSQVYSLRKKQKRCKSPSGILFSAL